MERCLYRGKSFIRIRSKAYGLFGRVKISLFKLPHCWSIVPFSFTPANARFEYHRSCGNEQSAKSPINIAVNFTGGKKCNVTLHCGVATELTPIPIPLVAPTFCLQANDYTGNAEFLSRCCGEFINELSTRHVSRNTRVAGIHLS